MLGRRRLASSAARGQTAGVTALDWDDFLRHWLAATGRAGATLSPASDQAVVDAERRFGGPLPSDYRAFLAVSDGFDDPAGHPITHVRGAGEVAAVAKDDQSWGRMSKSRLSDGVYFSYTAQASAEYRPAHLRHGLLLCGGERAGEGDAVILLNPQVAWPDGRYEAWKLANWIPGVERHRDFGEIMLDAAAQHFDVHEVRRAWRHTQADGPPTVFTGFLGSARRKGTPADVPDADALLRSVAEGKFRERMRAVKAMAGSGDARVGACLVDLLTSDPDERVRQAAVRAMIPRGDAASLAALTAAFENTPALRNDAAKALGNIRHPDATATLRAALDDADWQVFMAAGFALQERRDEALYPKVLAAALDVEADRPMYHNQRALIAWTLLGTFGERAGDDLLAALDHPNPHVRLRAASSLPEALLRDTAVQTRVLAALETVARNAPAQAANVRHHLDVMRLRLSILNGSRR